MDEVFKRVNVLDGYVTDMQRYAIALCRKQAVPDVKDGFKSVARRCLVGMSLDLHLNHTANRKKSAESVGTIMGKYHPHGDSSIYGTMVGMATWWDCKIPYIDGKGGWGNIQGDGASAYRYTECRCTEYTDECIIGQLASFNDIVDWVPNYNEQHKEPEYLPATIPNLLINGTLGIAIGMKVEIPTYNVCEVIDATIAVIKDPTAPVVLIPDHCQMVDIVDTNWKQICNTGYGTYKVRGHIDIEYEKDCPVLVIRSFPNGVTLDNSRKPDEGVIGVIHKMIKDGEAPFIIDIKDDTQTKKPQHEQLRYLIKLKKGTDPNYVKSLLYKKTLLETTCRINFEALDGIELNRYSFKSYIEYWIRFAMMLKFRTYMAQYNTAKSNWQELQLYIKLMESGDIELVKSKIAKRTKVDAEGKRELVEWIIKKFDVTDVEAEFILTMDMLKTAIGYLPIYKQKVKELEDEYIVYLTRANDDNYLKQEVIEDLLRYKKKYGGPRLCRVVKDKEDEVPAGTFKVVVTQNNYIKRIQENDKITAVRGDAPKFALVVDNRENVLLFDRVGKVYKMPVHKIPLTSSNNSGTDLRLMIKGCTADIICMMYEPTVKDLSKLKHKNHLVIATDMNCIKRIELDDIINVPPSGILYTKLNANDYVKDLAIIPEGFDIVLYSGNKALRFNVNDIPVYKRTAIGVAGIGNGNEIDGISVLTPQLQDIIVVTRGGKINKIPVEALPSKGRNKAAGNIIKLGKSDTVLSVIGVRENDTLGLLTSNGAVEVKVSDLKSGSSLSTGEKVVPDCVKVLVK